MKMIRLVSAILFILITSRVAAQNCASCILELEPDPTVHNGPAPFDPAGYISPSGYLDVGGMGSGALACFEINLLNFDFDLAGLDMEINYPAILTALSEQAGDWIPPFSGAVIQPGSFLTSQGVSIQQNPLCAGNPCPQTSLGNRSGKYAVSLTFNPPISGSPGTPNPGGAVLSICITFNPWSQPLCDSGLEYLYLPAGSYHFTDGSGNTVTAGTGRISTPFGDPSALIRGDANLDGVANATDALHAANCALNGMGGSGCAFPGNALEFVQVLDYNCDGAVNPLDAFPMALKLLGNGN